MRVLDHVPTKRLTRERVSLPSSLWQSGGQTTFHVSWTLYSCRYSRTDIKLALLVGSFLRALSSVSVFPLVVVTCLTPEPLWSEYWMFGLPNKIYVGIHVNRMALQARTDSCNTDHFIWLNEWTIIWRTEISAARRTTVKQVCVLWQKQEPDLCVSWVELSAQGPKKCLHGSHQR